MLHKYYLTFVYNSCNCCFCCWLKYYTTILI